MVRISRIAAGVLAGMLILVVGIGIAWGGAGPSGSETRLSVVGTIERFKYFDLNEKGNAGDSFLFAETLGNDRGTSHVVCWMHIGGAYCQGTIRINGRGTLNAEGFFPARASVTSIPVTGGTGDFDGAGGKLTVAETSTGNAYDFNLIFPAGSEFA